MDNFAPFLNRKFPFWQSEAMGINAVFKERQLHKTESTLILPPSFAMKMGRTSPFGYQLNTGDNFNGYIKQAGITKDKPDTKSLISDRNTQISLELIQLANQKHFRKLKVKLAEYVADLKNNQLAWYPIIQALHISIRLKKRFISGKSNSRLTSVKADY